MSPAKREAKTLFVTGSDTGVGKTVVAALLTRYLRGIGVNAVALKPICSGGRTDARQLWRAAGGVLSLDQVNPWHFRLPLAPLLAARRMNRGVTLEEVLHHVHQARSGFDCLVIEGAGGLLSPLGQGFDSRELIVALYATPILVVPNRLGAVNQVRLVLEALPSNIAALVKVVLVAPIRSDPATKTNTSLLSEFIPPARIYRLPRIAKPSSTAPMPALRALLAGLAAT